jgi:Holliday junction resolvase
MVNARQKGTKAEKEAAAMLKRHTGLDFVQTPGSGSGKIKGDLHVENKHNLFLIEVKHYKNMGLNEKIFTQKSNNIIVWWNKAIKQAQQMGQEPMILMKQNYSNWFVITTRKPTKDKRYMHINWLGAYVMNAEKGLEKEEMEFTNGDNILKPWEPDSEWELINS